MIKFLSEHWGSISLVLYLLISLTNAVTRHYSHHKGLAKAALFISEILSFLTSAKVENARLKLPGKTKL